MITALCILYGLGVLLLGIMLGMKINEPKKISNMTREEAIKILMGYSYTSEERTALGTLLPEFRMSEDERIRRKMIEHFKAKTKETWCNMPVKDIIAYLEKQKVFSNGEGLYYYRLDGDCTFIGTGLGPIEDIKLNWERPKTENKGVDLPGACCVEKQKEQDIPLEEPECPQFVYDDILALECAMDIAYRKGNEQALYEALRSLHSRLTDVLDNQQKEQKPVEPSDDELQRHQDELYDFKVFAAKQAKEHHISFVHDFEWNNFCAELLSYFNEKQKQQKPVQDKEEKEYVRTLKSLIADFLHGKNEIDRGYYQKIYDWLDGRHIKQEPEWSEEDENIIKNLIELVEAQPAKDFHESSKDTILKRLKSLRPQSKDEIYKEKDEAFKLGKHQLAIKFMNYLDENRPEGKMSLSNGECEDIDKAFKENDWAKIIRYAEKYLFHWKSNEEDEKDIAHIIEILDDCYAFGRHDLSKTEHENLVNKLKSLRPQPKPEWSEEDEEMLKCVIMDVESAKENYLKSTTEVVRQGAIIADKELAWLKSLRPQYHGDVTMTEAYKMGLEAGKASSWKPSEEQMKALEDAMNYIPEFYKPKSNLASLLRDLNKL